MSTLWELPGPGQFLAEIEQQLRASYAVAPVFPRTVNVSAFRTALERRVRTCELWSWRAIDVDEEPAAAATPLEYLFQRTCPFGTEKLAAVKDLIGFPEAQGIVFFVAGLSATDWDIWERFLSSYLQVVRNSDTADPPRFCLCLAGTHNPGKIREIAGLSVKYFDRYVEDHDVSMIVRSHVRSDLFPLQARVAIAVCTEVAGPDEGLAVALSQAPFNVVGAPTELLIREATARGWTSINGSALWADGMMEFWDGRIRKNSIALALAGAGDEISRRVWKGQVRVLFPAIEELRASLAKQLTPFCDLPFESKFGVIDAVEDLELSHLHYFARTNAAPRRVVHLLSILRNIRHALAHLETVRSDVLTDPVFVEACG